MAISKSTSTFLWGGATTTSTSGTATALNCASDYAVQAFVSIDQVGTATTAAGFSVIVSPDNTNWYTMTSFTTGLSAAYYYWLVDIPVTTQYVQIQFSEQVGGTSSTILAQLGQVTGV